MKAILRPKAVFWLGASAFLILHDPAWAVENAPEPDRVEDLGRLAELGERSLAAGDMAGLTAVEKKLAGMKADRPAALLALGRLLSSAEEYAEAAQALEQALALKPDWFEAEKELGPAYRELRKYEKAALIMEKALKQRPREYWLTIELGRCYVRMGRIEPAKAAFAQAKRINSKEAGAYIEQGYAYLNTGFDAQAKREFERLIAVDTASPIGYHHMGSYLCRQHYYPEAEKYLRRALSILEANPPADPDDLDHTLQWLGIVLQAQGRLAEAEAVYRKGLEQTIPDRYRRSSLLGALGMLANAQGKPGKAEHLFKQALAVCEPASKGACERAVVDGVRAYAELVRKSEAESLLEHLDNVFGRLPVNDESIAIFMLLADLNIKLGNSSKAEPLLRRILAARATLPAESFIISKAEAALAGLYEAQGRRGELEELYVWEIEVFKGHGEKGLAAGTLDRLAAVDEEERTGPEAAAARRQAEALRAQGGKS